MIGDVDRGSVSERVIPHAVIGGNQRGDYVRWGKCVAAVSGIGGGDSWRDRQARHRNIWNRGVVWVGSIDRNVRIAASRRHAKVGGTANVIRAASAGQPENAAVVRL